MKTYFKLICYRFIKSNYYTKFPSQLFSNYNLRWLSSTTPTYDINDLAKDKKDEVERRNIHLKNIINHKEKGLIYQEEIGPDVKVVYVADPSSCAKIFREGM